VKVEVIKGYDVSGAEDDFLPKDDLPDLTERYKCGECDTIYEDRDEAKECCKE